MSWHEKNLNSWHHKLWLHHEVNLSSTNVQIQADSPAGFSKTEWWTISFCLSCAHFCLWALWNYWVFPLFYIANTDVKCAWQGPKEKHQHFCVWTQMHRHGDPFFSLPPAQFQGYSVWTWWIRNWNVRRESCFALWLHVPVPPLGQWWSAEIMLNRKFI